MLKISTSYILFIVSALSFNLLAQRSSTLYTIEDLKALNANENYFELLQHTHDIRPSQRKEEWRKISTNAAKEFISTIINRKKIYPHEIKVIKKITRYNFFKTNSLLQDLMDDMIESEVYRCGKNKICLTSLLKVWEQLSNAPRSAKVLIDKSNILQESLSLQTRKLLGKTLVEDPKCEMKKTVSFLYDLSLRDLKSKEFIQKSLNQSCTKILRPELLRWVYNYPINQAEFAYNILKLKNIMPKPAEDFFLVRYYIEKPQNGPMLNLAWNKIEDLSNDYRRRDKVFQMLKVFDPVPDSLFALKNKKRRFILSRHLNSHFPEYFDHYEKTCLSYYQGKGNFSKGNPTIECQRIIKEKEKQFFSKNIRAKILEELQI